METLSCHSNDAHVRPKAINKIVFVEANHTNISALFKLYSPYGFWGIIFIGNLAFLLPWQPIKFRGMDKNNMSVKFLWNSCQNICSEIAIKANFHFSHYKSMGTLSCHSNESTRATPTRNTTFVEANVMNIFAQFQLRLPYDFWRDGFWKFVRKVRFSVAMATNRIQRFEPNSLIW